MAKLKYKQTTLKNRRPAKVHRLIAEKAAGFKLPKTVHVHHVNCNSLDNRNTNLVICPDAAYHALLHRRTRLLNRGIDPDIHNSCSDCHRVKPLADFTRCNGRHTNVCKSCATTRAMARYNAKPKLPRKRVDYCKHGHEYTPENTLHVIEWPKPGRKQVNPYHGRHCRTCIRLRSESHNARKRERRGQTRENRG